MERIKDEIEAKHPKGTPLTKPDFWWVYIAHGEMAPHTYLGCDHNPMVYFLPSV